MRTRTLTVLAAAFLALGGPVRAGDWPQWNGPRRDGHADENGLLKSWPKGGPKLLWTYKEAGTGYTAGAVVGGKVYTMGCRGEDEYVICLDDKGKQLWATKIGPVFWVKTNQWSRGPNSTPSIDGAMLYAVGSQGILVCLDTASGKLNWQLDMAKNMAGEVNNIFGGPDTAKFGWGYCWSPLVDGDHLIITPGGPKGLVAALDKKTGKEVWRSKTVPDPATYSSCIVADVQGVRQYIVMVQTGAVGVDAKTGAELWRFTRANPFPDVVCPTPIFYKDHVYITAVDGTSNLIKLTKNGEKFDTKDVYTRPQSRELVNSLGGVVLVKDYLYGAQGKTGPKCVEIMKPKLNKAWYERMMEPAGVVYADGLLVWLTQESGEVVLSDADPTAFMSKGSFTLPMKSAAKVRTLSGKVWTRPVISDGKLYLRDQELIFCYQIK